MKLFSFFIVLAAVCTWTRGLAALKDDNEVDHRQDSDVNLQDSDVANQQDSDVTLQDSDVANQQDSEKLPDNSDMTLQDSDVVQERKRKAKFADQKVTVQDIKREKQARKKHIGIAFPSTDINNPRKFMQQLQEKVSVFKQIYGSEIKALEGLQVKEIMRDEPITKVEAASEILCVIEQLYDIIPGTQLFVMKMVRFHGPKYGVKSFDDFSIIRNTGMGLYQRNECQVTQGRAEPLSMLPSPVQLQVKNLLIYLILAELEYKREIKRDIE